MNVSMMDSFNLAWKLAYSIHGLTTDPNAMLDSYHTERHTIAQQLITFDRTFSSMFSGKMGSDEEEDGADQGLTHDQFLDVFNTGNGFTSGCGVEYPEDWLVNRTFDASHKTPIQGTDPLLGILYPGRRLLNVQAKRHADGNRRDIQDGMSTSFSLCSSFSPNGRFPINRPIPCSMSYFNRPVRTNRYLSSGPNSTWISRSSSIP